MPLQTHRVARRQHAASFMVASCVTVATMLLMLGALGPRFVRPQASGPVTDARRLSERLEYVVPPLPDPAVPPARQVRRPPARLPSQPVVGSVAPETISALPSDSTAPAPPAPVPSVNPGPGPANGGPKR